MSKSIPHMAQATAAPSGRSILVFASILLFNANVLHSQELNPFATLHIGAGLAAAKNFPAVEYTGGVYFTNAFIPFGVRYGYLAEFKADHIPVNPYHDLQTISHWALLLGYAKSSSIGQFAVMAGPSLTDGVYHNSLSAVGFAAYGLAVEVWGLVDVSGPVGLGLSGHITINRRDSFGGAAVFVRYRFNAAS